MSDISSTKVFDKDCSKNMLSDIDNCLYPKSKCSPHILTYVGD